MLPSIAMDDEIIGIEVKPKDAKFSVQRSENTGLYYIETDRKISVGYLLQNKSRAARYDTYEPMHKLSSDAIIFKDNGEIEITDEKFNELPVQDKKLSLIKYFTDFSQQELTEKSTDPKKILQAIIKERKGTCHHMARGFVYMAGKLDISAKLIVNDSHDMVEVLLDGKYQTVNLGGAPGPENKREFKDVMQEPIDQGEIKESKQEQKEEINSNAKEELTEEDMKDNPFKVWDKIESKAKTMTDYAKELVESGDKLNLGKKNILCNISKDKIENLYKELMELEEVYFISDFDKISLQEVIIDGDNISKQDSRLAKFIKSGKGILLVDWSDYKSEHVGYNSMMDSNGRKIKGLNIPDGIKIISILDNQYGAGEDFYSRHGLTSKCPDNLEKIEKKEKGKDEKEEEFIEIEFYTDSWKKEIFGSIKIAEKGYIYVNSKLIEAVKSGAKNIKLINAPWSDREFRIAIEEIIGKKKIYANGKEYDVENINFIMEDKPYDLSGLEIKKYDRSANYEVVNKLSINSLFDRYIIDKEGNLKPAEIDKNRKFLVTEDLSIGQWKILLDSKIDISITENVKAPGSIKQDNVKEKEEKKIKVIKTNDLGLYKSEHESEYDLIIEINSETKASDLIQKISYKNEKFSNEEMILSKELRAGKKIMLVGNPSAELSRNLESLFLDNPYAIINGKSEKIEANITLATEKSNTINFVKEKEKIFTQEDIWKAIQNNNKIADEEFAKLREKCKELKLSFSYTEILSIVKRMAEKPLSNPLKHMLRLREDYKDIKARLDILFPKSDKKEKSKSRGEKISKSLKNHDHVFLVGPSGVGKSRFVQEELSGQYNIIEGMGKLEDFVKESEDKKPKILFLDEANITATPDMYEVFRGFLEGKGKILVDGELRSVPKGNKIVFAGNYKNFEGRVDIRLINDFGNIVTFKDLSQGEITEQVIDPLLNSLFGKEITQDQKNQAAKIIYSVYSKLNENSAEEKVLTIRNIQMMLMRYNRLYEKLKDHNMALALGIYDEASPLLNKIDRQGFREEFLNSLMGVKKGEIKAKKHILSHK